MMDFWEWAQAGLAVFGGYCALAYVLGLLLALGSARRDLEDVFLAPVLVFLIVGLILAALVSLLPWGFWARWRRARRKERAEMSSRKAKLKLFTGPSAEES